MLRCNAQVIRQGISTRIGVGQPDQQHEANVQNSRQVLRYGWCEITKKARRSATQTDFVPFGNSTDSASFRLGSSVADHHRLRG